MGIWGTSDREEERFTDSYERTLMRRLIEIICVLLIKRLPSYFVFLGEFTGDFEEKSVNDLGGIGRKIHTPFYFCYLSVWKSYMCWSRETGRSHIKRTHLEVGYRRGFT